MKRFLVFNLLLLAVGGVVVPAAQASDAIDLNGDGSISLHERRLDFLSPGAGS